MNHDNYPVEEGVEVPFDEEWASFARESPFRCTTTTPRVDSAGFPMSLPPAEAATPSVPSSVSWPTNEVADRNVFSTPPRTKRSEKHPGTPDTISSRQDADEEEPGELDFANFYKEDEDENKSTSLSGGSGSDSSQTDAGEYSKKGRWPAFKTKSAMVAAMVMLALLLIAILVTIVVFLSRQKSENTMSPTISLGPSSSPTRFPTSLPSTTPSLGPSSNPTRTPTSPPSRSPSSSPSSSPSRLPTRLPSQSPTVSFEAPIRDFFEDSSVDVSPSNPAVSNALEWLVDEANEAQSLVFPLDPKYLQRFGILILYFSVNPDIHTPLPSFSMRNQDECSWIGMRCNGNGMVTEIKMSNLQLDGTLPTEWGAFFPNLKSIDFSKNELKGSVPEGLYDVSGLEEVHLYKNQLVGTISSKIGNLWSLRRFHLSHNRLSGSIPPELRNARPLRSFNVHRNQMMGSIPFNMDLRQLYYMDLGRNQFSGTVPPDLGTESVRLRHLYLDHNNFGGTFPSEVLNAGDGRLRALSLNDNQFNGIFPGDHQLLNYKVELTIQNNNFVSMGTNTCLLDTFAGGELVEFKSDCSICQCGDTYLCQYCQP